MFRILKISTVLVTVILAASPSASGQAAFVQQSARHFGLEDGLPGLDIGIIEMRGSSAGPRVIAAQMLTPDAPDAVFDGHWKATENPWLFEWAEPPGMTDTSLREFAFGGNRSTDAVPRICPVLAATSNGAFLQNCSSTDWERLLPSDGDRSWALTDVGAVGISDTGDLWIASRQGVAFRGPDGWRLYDGTDGLPYNDFTSLAVGPEGDVWFGTTKGAIHFDGTTWEYRQGKRWLASDNVRDVMIDDQGNVWFATDQGVTRIESKTTTLAEKAQFFEAEIDRYHRRTEWEFVDSVRLTEPGNRDDWVQRDSDNDGLWTGMYGAGECFAYAATGQPEYKERAQKAFRALAFLSEVTQGGSHSAPPGFPARTVLPTSGPDPNIGRQQADREKRRDGDRMWKLIDPRWPISADGRWYWKTDTSSDELDGHYFLYAAYYDHVAEADAERQQVQAVVRRVTDHLLTNHYALIDHDGLPTRWAVFGPDQLNQDPRWWGERGLNSLSVISYLRVAAHITGDSKYSQAARELLDEHSYGANIREPKVQSGPGTGNESDDEMAFMSFYNLLRYETNEELRPLWLHSFHRYWQREAPERNPLFHYLYAGSVRPGETFVGTFETTVFDPAQEWLDDALDTLKRYPLDRVDWALDNSHRIDLIRLDGEYDRGMRRDGKVLPIDERYVDHWNHDPWRLDSPGNGSRLADGASFLLPYYLGLYLDLIAD